MACLNPDCGCNRLQWPGPSNLAHVGLYAPMTGGHTYVPSWEPQNTPSPTGTELALNEAKRHIAILTKFWMDNADWRKASEDARVFISGKPRQE